MSPVVLTYDEYRALMNVVVDWMIDDIEGTGPTEFPFTAQEVLRVIEAHGTGGLSWPEDFTLNDPYALNDDPDWGDASSS